MKLIVNADDFGLSKAVNYGIIEAFKTGIVSSTTILSTMPAFSHAVELAKNNPNLKIGLHLNLTLGKSILKGHKTITDKDGGFLKQQDFIDLANTVDLKEVEAEYTAQIELALDAGLKLTHLDGHHHIHALPVFWDTLKKLCKKYNLATRCINEPHINFFKADNIKTNAAFSSDFYNKNANYDNLVNIINNCYADSLEIMCHPAFIDKDLYESTSYGLNRIYEYDILTSDEIKKYITDNDIQLCGFDEL